MNNIPHILELGFYEGLTWFPIVLAIGIIYKYMNIIDVSIDGIAIISAIAFVSFYNFTSYFTLSCLLTFFVAVLAYTFVSFLSHELRINNILSGIILSLIMHSISIICIGESMALNYKAISFISSHSMTLIIAVTLAFSTHFLFASRFGIRLRVATDNPNVNISSNPRMLSLFVYIISGIILSIGVIQYTSRVGLARSGGGFEYLITALSSFLFIDKIVDLLVDFTTNKQKNYSYSKYLFYSIIQSPVFKALIGSILFQIIVLLIIYYTNNPAYWKLIFGIILLLTVANPKIRLTSKLENVVNPSQNISVNKLSFKYNNGYEERIVFKDNDFEFKPGLNIIWGNNGVGKTSLLKLLSGELNPNSGSIIKDGINITTLKRHERNVFFIRQTPFDSLSVNSTVFENAVAVSPSFSRKEFALKSASSKVSNSFHGEIFFGKENPFWVQKSQNLSGGLAQKLNLFLCSISSADMILADEPTSGMDKDNFKLFINFVNEIQSKNKKMIIVTHDERLRSLAANHIFMSNPT